MSVDLVKRQHFVPRTYLKYFGEQRGDDYYIEVLPFQETDVNKIFNSNIKNVALEKHLYTLPGETNEQKMAIEKFYADEIEAHYDRIYRILTDPNKIEITLEERDLIISTVITMYYRTTKWVNISRGVMERVIEMAYQLCEQTDSNEFTFENQKISILGKNHKELTAEINKERQPGMIIIQLETAFKLISLRLKNDSICVYKIEGDNLEFITSDNPVIAKNNSSVRFAPFDPSNILELPLDSKHKLVLMPNCPEELQHLIFRRTSKIPFSEIEKLTTNYSQMQNSEKFIFGSRTSLESYLLTKQESERPIGEGENPADIYKKLKELGL